MSEKVSTSAVHPEAGPAFAWTITAEEARQRLVTVSPNAMAREGPERRRAQFISAPGGHTTKVTDSTQTMASAGGLTEPAGTRS